MGGRLSQKGKNNNAILISRKPKKRKTNEVGHTASANKKKKTTSEISEKQRKLVSDVESGKIPLEGYEGHKKGNHTRKGNYGEMKTDLYMEKVTEINGKKVTLTPLHKKIDDIDAKTHKGIDNVYKCSDPPPQYVIADSKYGSSSLGKTKDGKQMSDPWITGSGRLEKAVGEEEAFKIRQALKDNEVHRVLVNIDKSGNVTTKKLNELAKIEGSWP